jgi:hypothetical protein
VVTEAEHAIARLGMEGWLAVVESRADYVAALGGRCNTMENCAELLSS